MLRISILIFLFAFSLTAVGQPDFSNQNEMERALIGVSSIDQLLNSTETLDKYYIAVNNYYQGKIARENFNAIIEQMRLLVEFDPQIGVQLLSEQAELKPYALVSDVKTYGRRINSKSWAVKRRNIIGPANVSKNTIEEKSEMLNQISQDIQNFENSIANESKKSQGLKRSQFYQSIKTENKELFQSVIASIFYHDPDIKVLLAQGPDPDLLFYVLDHLIKEKLKASGLRMNLVSIISSTIPKTSELLANKILFPVQTYITQRGTKAPVEPMLATVYNFLPFKRRIHAVWKGIWLGECVGGQTITPTPRRWALAALNSVHNYTVEKNNTFIGFIQEVGMKKANHHAIYYATEFGAPNLKENILVMNPKTQLPQKVPMIDQWLASAPKNIVRVKSESRAINNAGVIPVLSQSKNWNLRFTKGSSSNYELADQRLADSIIKGAKLKIDNDATPTYGNGMISDATVSNAGNLETLIMVKWNPQALRKFLLKGNMTFDSFQEAMTNSPENFEKIDKSELLREMSNKKSTTDPFEFLKVMKLFLSLKFISQAEFSAHANKMLNQSYSSSTTLAKIYVELGNEAIEHLRQKQLTYSFLSHLYEGMGAGPAQDKISKLISQRILNERLAELYPIVLQYANTLLTSNTLRTKFIRLLQNITTAERPILEKTLPYLANILPHLSDQTKIDMLSPFIKENLLGSLRKEISKSPHFYLTSTSFLGEQFNIMLLQDAISQNDFDYVEKILNAKSNYVPGNIPLFNKALTLILQSENPTLIALLNTRIVDVLIRFVRSPKQQLSPEMIVYYGLKKSATNTIAVNPDSYLAAISPRTEKETNNPIAQKDSVAVLSKPIQNELAHVKPKPLLQLNYIDTLFEKLLNLNNAEEINTLQTQIESTLKKGQLLSVEATTRIEKKLSEIIASSSVPESKIYSVMALFEISSQHQNIPYEIFHLSRQIADRILSRPEFAGYRNLYTGLFEARGAPVKCEILFVD